MDLKTVSNEMQELYNTWKTIVWVIRIRFKKTGTEFESFGTAFSVSSEGLIITTAHIFPPTSCAIDVRRLDEAIFHPVNIVFEKRKWDVVLLHLTGVNCQHAILANDNSLLLGQTLLHIGNPDNFVGSFLVGKVAFECVHPIEIPTNNLICRTYEPTARTIPPRYRIMGDVWYRHVFGPSSGRSFEKNLHPLVPIIQMYGLVGGEGCSGGPVFNGKGEVVGMFAMNEKRYEIVIHVAILRETLRLFKEQHLDDEDGKRKHVPNPKVQVGDSKKSKAL